MVPHPGRLVSALWLRALALSLLSSLGAGPVAAQLGPEPLGVVEALPSPPSAHWLWASDGMLERMALIDLDSGRMLGTVGAGWGFPTAVFPGGRNEMWVPETHYSRGSRGERTDVVTHYDLETLAPGEEIAIPPRRAHNVLAVGNAAVTDDDRFLAVFNMNPATSLSIVDLAARRFVDEIETAGCSLAYAAGDRRIAMLCVDGSMLVVTLDDSGALASRWRSEPFFDPESDPVTEKSARVGERRLFVSFDGHVHTVDFSSEPPRFLETWSLVDDEDRAGSWRIGGAQHLAAHEQSGRLYALMHQGGVDTHKQGGSEIWVYDLAERSRVQRIALKSPGLSYLGVPLDFDQSWVWPFNWLYEWVLDQSVEAAGIGAIVVTQDAEPLLATTAFYTGSVGVYDALSGEFLRRVNTGNTTNVAIAAPWGGR